MVAILYSLLFILIWVRYKKRYKNSVGAWLLLWYVVSSILTVIENFTFPINSEYLDPIATTYYASSQLIALLPFLYLGRYDCRNFRFSCSLFTYVAYVLIPFGLLHLGTSVYELSANLSILFGDIAQLRNNFYDTFLESSSATPFEKVTIIVNHFQYMSPFIAFFFLCKGERGLAMLLFISSLGAPMGQIVKGEREGVLTYLVNLYFCYLFFKPAIAEATLNKLKKSSKYLLAPLVLFIVAMTLGRFGNEGNEGLLRGLFLYGGDQPFLFTTFFNDTNLLSQVKWGRINFQYFFPVPERVQGQINLYIDSEIYLNQFAGMPGSFFLDFGYHSITVISVFSFLYFFLIRVARKRNKKYPLHILFLFYFSFQVLYMNIFYFDFHSLFYILMSVFFFIVCCVYTGKTESLDIHPYAK